MSTTEKRSLQKSSFEVKTPVIVLDIEGTTTSISFVKDTLFPYVREHLEKYVTDNWEKEDFKTLYDQLIEQSTKDVEDKMEGAVALNKEDEDAKGALIKNIIWQMDNDRKTMSLKMLQGQIYRGGYEAGDLKGHIYEDVVSALKQWKSAEKKVYIYSSGSVEAQKLLFGHTSEGDLLEMFAGFFDTEVGAKGESKSYTTIAEKVEKKPEEITFFTDVVKEASAAKEAGLEVVLVEREGNEPLTDDTVSSFTVVTSLLFEEEEVNPTKKAKLDEEETVKEPDTTEDKVEEPAKEPVEEKVEDKAEEKVEEMEQEEKKEVNGTNGHTNGTNGTNGVHAEEEVKKESDDTEAAPVKKVVTEEATAESVPAAAE